MRPTERLVQGSKVGEAAVPRKRGRGRQVPQLLLSALKTRVPGPWLIFRSLRPISYQAGLASPGEEKGTLFGMAVTLQELSCKDSDPHGFLTMKGKGEWKIREMDKLIECMYSFSKCLLAGHCSSR